MKYKRALSIIALLFLLITLLLSTVFVMSDREQLTLDDSTRAQNPGIFVALPDGYVHYEDSGPLEGEIVLLVHGFSAPLFTWDRNVDALTSAGYRVLRFDLYGRGTSDRPAGPYTIDLFMRQINGLLDALEIDRPVHVVGLSMGGLVSATFANRYPNRVASLCLVDPQVIQITHRTIFPVGIPGLGEYLYTVYIQPNILAKQADSFYNPALLPEWQARYREQTQYKGFRRALISTLRNLDLDPLRQYQQIGVSGLPVLLVMGEQDVTVPVERAQDILARIPQAEFHILPDAGHISNYERADLFNPILVDFLDRQLR